ncbi:MAG: PorT family protein [Bacteroidales bacterium]|nr:PorT family protein [Bacteroidales bacterium]
MKKILFLILSFVAFNSFSQKISEEAKRKFQFGFDIYTDFWQERPGELDIKSLNPGVNVVGSYNFIFGNGNLSFSPGLGLGVHNMYSNSLTRTVNDSTYFKPVEEIAESVSYKKAKFTATYLDIPIELRFKSKSQFRIAVGFKFGFLLKAQTKYKGDDYLEGNADRVIYKKGRIKNVEKNRYGFTARIGYKWLNLWGYYQLSSLFVTNKGPQMYPISLGISIIPY